MKLGAMAGFFFLVAVVALTCSISASTSTSGSLISSGSSPSGSPISSTEPSLTDEQRCGVKSGGVCSECVDVKEANCYYCSTSKECFHYQTRTLFPKGDCEWSKIQWYTCTINFKAMVISLAVIGGVILLSLIICICCCCRKKKKSSKYAHEEAKRDREREERRVRGQLKQKERQSKYDEIRKKYGLNKDDPPYQKFDA